MIDPDYHHNGVLVDVLSTKHPWTQKPGWLVIAVEGQHGDAAVDCVARRLGLDGWGTWMDGTHGENRAIVMYRKDDGTSNDN